MPLPKKLFTSVISNDWENFPKVLSSLEELFGPSDYISNLLLFDYTDYYEKEMGKNLKRRIVSFEYLLDPELLSWVKLQTNRVEEQFSVDGRRRFNLDPGILDLARLILLTTKDYTHRIYIGNGIYAEVTLLYKNKNFLPLPWTYPDYRSTDLIDIFKIIREKYRVQIKEVK